MDVDLDAYADGEDTATPAAAPPVEPRIEPTMESKRISVLEAAERAGIPLEVLLPKLAR